MLSVLIETLGALAILASLAAKIAELLNGEGKSTDPDR